MERLTVVYYSYIQANERSAMLLAFNITWKKKRKITRYHWQTYITGRKEELCTPRKLRITSPQIPVSDVLLYSLSIAYFIFG